MELGRVMTAGGAAWRAALRCAAQLAPCLLPLTAKAWLLLAKSGAAAARSACAVLVAAAAIRIVLPAVLARTVAGVALPVVAAVLAKRVVA